MKSQNFTGTFGGGGGQNVFSSTSQQRDDPFAGGTPAPKPNYARRLGTSLMGGIANPALRASGNDPSFSSINLPRVAQDQFKKIGERAANQDIDNFNAVVTAENNAATAAKQAEIDAYDTEVNRLTNEYNTALDVYNSAWSSYNADVDKFGRLETDINALNDRYTNYKFYEAIVNDPSRARDLPVYRPLYETNRNLFNSFSSHLKGQNPGFDHLFTGQFTRDSLVQPDIQQPDQPNLPTAPDPFVDLKQTKNRLDDPVDRRLAGSQREIVGGDLPPQEATTSGDVFAQLDVPFRDLSELNSAEKQSLGLPKAYRFATGFTAQSGNNQSFGGQTFLPSDIGNQTDTHFFIKNFGWVAKSQLTPLY